MSPTLSCYLFAYFKGVLRERAPNNTRHTAEHMPDTKKLIYIFRVSVSKNHCSHARSHTQPSTTAKQLTFTRVANIVRAFLCDYHTASHTHTHTKTLTFTHTHPRNVARRPNSNYIMRLHRSKHTHRTHRSFVPHERTRHPRVHPLIFPYLGGPARYAVCRMLCAVQHASQPFPHARQRTTRTRTLAGTPKTRNHMCAWCAGGVRCACGRTGGTRARALRVCRFPNTLRLVIYQSSC